MLFRSARRSAGAAPAGSAAARRAERRAQVLSVLREKDLLRAPVDPAAHDVPVAEPGAVGLPGPARVVLAPVVAVEPKRPGLPPGLPAQFGRGVGEADADQPALADGDDLDLEVGYGVGARGGRVGLDGADVVGVGPGARVGDGELVLGDLC